ncbi:AsmA-like C-terminal region-containing protein [Aureimonas populi]|uniref:AsmA-like C-terminal region-containing protein n=2 Tax=Aureimonas populi TaxID=1701758 RepID=A0ABW5CLG1_9HYPH
MPTGERHATRRGRIALLALIPALVLAVIAAAWIAGASSFSLNAAGAQADLEARLSELTGEPVIVDGTAQFSLLPSPLLTLSSVRIGADDGGPILRIEGVQAEFDLLDALLGRTDIGRLILLRPSLAYPEAAPEQAGTSPGAATAASPPASAEADGAGEAGPGNPALDFARDLLGRFEGIRSVELREGTFRPKDGSLGITNVALRLDWPARDAPAELAGSFVWRGEPTEIAFRARTPAAFLEGGASELSLSLSAPPLRASFAGTGTGGERLGLDGQLSLSVPSPTRAATWLGRETSRLPDIGPMSLDTRIRLEGSEMTLPSAQVGLGEQRGQGALEMSFDKEGRPTLSGTLAFPRLDFDRFAQAVAPYPRHALDYQRPIPVAFIGDFDLDLRLSATEGGFSGLPLQQFAATLKFARGQGLLDIGDAELLGGRAQARLSLDLTGARPFGRGRIELAGVDAAGLAGLLDLGTLGLSGRASLTADVAAPITNWTNILREGEVASRLSVSQGQIAGFSPRLAEAGQSTLRLETDAAPVPFSSIEARLRSRGPYVNLEGLSVENAAGRIEATGFFSVLDDQLFVTGTFRPQEEGESEAGFTPSQEIGFRMQGEWPNPTVIVADGERPI